MAMQNRLSDLEPGVTATQMRAIGSAPRPLLSVLVPFYNVSPAPLVRDLLHRVGTLGDPVEIIVADDGSNDRRPCKEVEDILATGASAATLLVSRRNNGRAGIRNLMARAARGQYVLYLDSDMRLGSPNFLETYITVCRERDPDVVYGGFRVVAPAESSDALPAFFANRSDCAPIEQRKADPAKHTLTNNLLVRRSLVRDIPFDERFVGWGWEDVEWALRAAERCRIEHIDNPVISPGSSCTEELLTKFGGSARNFDLLRRRHPGAAARYPIYRASRLASRVPFAAGAAPMFAKIARDRLRLFPLLLRYCALKLYRACIYSPIFGPRF